MMEDSAFKRQGQQGRHYSEIRTMGNTEHGRALAQGWAQNARRAVVPAGGLLLWSSRTVHSGWKGGPRLAQAVCFEPASRRPAQERIAKLRLAALGLASAHWAAVGMQHDMSLGSAGACGTGTTRAAGSKSGDPSQMLLPLRSHLWPAGLAGSADFTYLKQ